MERVAFILMHSDERISCMLNPQSIVLRRHAGLKPKRTLGGAFSATEQSDTPISHTGGGITELDLDLLFDVSIAGSSVQTQDVRDITSPFWEMAENMIAPDGRQIPPQVRFVWGKSWNIPGVILKVSEKFDRFTKGGSPTRSWMRLRLLRVMESLDISTNARYRHRNVLIPQKRQDSTDADMIRQTVSPIDRLDILAFRYYGDPSYWRLLATYNNITDPLHLDPTRTIQIVPLSELQERS